MTDRNAYEVHNRITFAAHGRSFRNRRSLQEIGGEFLSRASTWPVIAGATYARLYGIRPDRTFSSHVVA